MWWLKAYTERAEKEGNRRKIVCSCTIKNLIQQENQITIRKTNLKSSFSMTEGIWEWMAVTVRITNKAGLELVIRNIFYHFSFWKNQNDASPDAALEGSCLLPFSQLPKCSIAGMLKSSTPTFSNGICHQFLTTKIWGTCLLLLIKGYFLTIF